MKIETVQLNWDKPDIKRLHEIVGNEVAKRAIMIALAGSHELVLLSTSRSPASDLLQAASRMARENNWPFKGSVVPVCACGNYGNPREECICSDATLQEYARKIRPMFKRAAIIVEVIEPNQREYKYSSEQEANIVAVVLAVRQDASILSLSGDAESCLKMAMTEIRCDRDKTIAVAMTIAKTDHCKTIQAQHIIEASQYQHRHMANWVDDFERVEV